MKVNGKEIAWKEDCCLYDFLEQQGYRMDKIAVERNMEIVPKKKYKEIMLTECDTLEVVSFVGGG